MRIAVGAFAQESHSFTPVPGSWEHFGPGQVARGQEIVDRYAETRTEFGGGYDVARTAGAEIIPTLTAKSSASAGPMRREVFDAILGELLERLRSAAPFDGVFMILHGSMVVQDLDDGSGEILRAVRQEIGPDIPLVGTLDLHANVTRKMVREATALAGYHSAPHIDQYETGQRGMRLLLSAMRGEVHPVMALRRLPMILPGETSRTTDGPYAEVVDQARGLMNRPPFLDASAFSVQPWLDIPDVACSILVVSDGDGEAAEMEADRLANEFWERRTRFEPDLVPTGEAIRRALASDRHPFVLADSADAPTSGAPGDSTVVLQALLDACPQKDCLLNIVDPVAVRRMADVGVGREVTLSAGASQSRQLYQPVAVTGRVKLLSDGDFVMKGPGFHGSVMHRGLTGVLQIGHVYLVVMEQPVNQWDAELYRSVGLEPADAAIVVPKSPAGFRATYEPFAAEVLILDAPGVCSPNLRSFPWKRIGRPIYPLDDVADRRTDRGI